MSNIRVFPGCADRDPDALLQVAREWGCNEIMIIGKCPDGERVWGASTMESRDINIALDWAKYKLIKEAFE